MGAVSFDPLQRAIPAQTPLGAINPRKRHMTVRILDIMKSANWINEAGEPVAVASVADRLAALNRLDFRGNQIIGDLLGNHGLRLERRKIKGKTVFLLPPGGISRELLEQSFDCTGWRWNADEDAGQPDQAP
jgi:hypothetical protein